MIIIVIGYLCDTNVALNVTVHDVVSSVTKTGDFPAKKLPKNEQATAQGGSGQGRRLAEGDTGAKAAGNCCK